MASKNLGKDRFNPMIQGVMVFFYGWLQVIRFSFDSNYRHKTKPTRAHIFTRPYLPLVDMICRKTDTRSINGRQNGISRSIACMAAIRSAWNEADDCGCGVFGTVFEGVGKDDVGLSGTRSASWVTCWNVALGNWERFRLGELHEKQYQNYF